MDEIFLPSRRAHAQATRDAFAKKLNRMMVDRGWNQSDLARAAAKFIPAGANELTRQDISTYTTAKMLPRPIKLTAIAKALGVESSELLSDARDPVRPPPMEKPTPMAMRAIDDEFVWLQLNQRIRLEDALKIMQILKESKEAGE